MARKTKTTKPLPSVLTAATSGQPNSQTTLAAAKSAQAEAVKPSASTPKATVRGKIPSPRAPQTVKVTFTLLEPRAKRVSLCGEFSAWSPTATPMNQTCNGHWATSLALPPGRHEYKFVVDGHWVPDPNAQQHEFNGYGTLNSVVEVRA